MDVHAVGDAQRAAEGDGGAVGVSVAGTLPRRAPRNRGGVHGRQGGAPHLQSTRRLHLYPRVCACIVGMLCWCWLRLIARLFDPAPLPSFPFISCQARWRRLPTGSLAGR